MKYGFHSTYATSHDRNEIYMELPLIYHIKIFMKPPNLIRPCLRNK